MSVGVRIVALSLSLVFVTSCGGAQPESASTSPSAGDPAGQVAVVAVADPREPQATSAPDPGSAVPTEAVAAESFTEASAAQAAVERVSETQEMLYADNDRLSEIVGYRSTTNGRRDLQALIDEGLAPMRRALAAAPPAATWFVVRPLSVQVPIMNAEMQRAETTVWTIELFSRVGVADPEMLFFETDIGLVWTGTEWDLDAYTVRPGPVARLGDEQYPLTAPELEVRLENHRIIDPATLEGWGI